MFYHQSAVATRRGYQISLIWLWSTRVRVTDSDQLSSAGFEPTAVLTFGLRVRRLNHSAMHSLMNQRKFEAADFSVDGLDFSQSFLTYSYISLLYFR